jgi:hypothetical protein
MYEDQCNISEAFERMNVFVEDDFMPPILLVWLPFALLKISIYRLKIQMLDRVVIPKIVTPCTQFLVCFVGIGMSMQKNLH